MDKTYVIADPETDGEDFWKFQRRRHLTASDVFKFIPRDVLLERGWHVESWMARDVDGAQQNMNWVRRDVFNRKMTGGSIKFKDPVAVLWGQKEEDHNRELFTRYSGVTTTGSHSMIKNERWPYLTCTLDGFIEVPKEWTTLAHPEMFDKPRQVQAALEQVRGKEALLEMKQTSDFGWTHWHLGKKTEPKNIVDGIFRPCGPSVPVYYRPQVLTQMAIMGVDLNVAVVKAGASHMTAHTMELDLDFLDVLDIINEQVKDDILQIREALDAAD